MIVILNADSGEKEIESIIKYVEQCGLQAEIIKGAVEIALGIIGDISKIDEDKIDANNRVKKILHVSEPYKRANRAFHPENSVFDILGNKIGGGELALIAGPCSVESEEQIVNIARSIKESGASFLRGGAFKPRTSHYSFQGLELQGLELLKKAKEITGLPIVTEIMSPDMIERFNEDVDIIQVGARNMQNFDLLKRLGEIRKPILLKRGMSCTMEELVMSAEYILAGGNDQVILCERGIRTFESYTRNTLDLSIIPCIKRMSHLPIIIDPSHATGLSWAVESMAMAAIAAGADGIMVEVHNDPQHALCDGKQSITPEAFNRLSSKLKSIKNIVKGLE